MKNKFNAENFKKYLAEVIAMTGLAEINISHEGALTDYTNCWILFSDKNHNMAIRPPQAKNLVCSIEDGCNLAGFWSMAAMVHGR